MEAKARGFDFDTDYVQLYADGKISEYELRQKLGYKAGAQLNSRIQAAQKLHQMNTAGKKNMRVLYICGSSGSGKTTTAKYFAEELGYKYCVSAGGSHMFDDYHGEPCLILDDFRASYMKFSDLLKLMDNNTGSCVDARYHNINMAFCRLLIITSINEPKELYSNLFEGDEPIEQFIRRLNNRNYIEIIDDNILEVSADTNKLTGKTFGKFSIDVMPKYINNEDNDNLLDSLYKGDVEVSDYDKHDRGTGKCSKKIYDKSTADFLEKYYNKKVK